MKLNLFRLILIILLLGTFFIIFGFSNQNSEESGGLSNKVAIFLFEKFSYDSIENNIQIIDLIESIIRKIAHFSIYTVVGFLLMLLISTYSIKENRRILFSLCIGITYAASDEIHQLFVPGRSGQITDVILDSMGVGLGILIVLLILKLYEIIKNKYHNCV